MLQIDYKMQNKFIFLNLVIFIVKNTILKINLRLCVFFENWGCTGFDRVTAVICG